MLRRHFKTVNKSKLDTFNIYVLFNCIHKLSKNIFISELLKLTMFMTALTEGSLEPMIDEQSDSPTNESPQVSVARFPHQSDIIIIKIMGIISKMNLTTFIASIHQEAFPQPHLLSSSVNLMFTLCSKSQVSNKINGSVGSIIG